VSTPYITCEELIAFIVDYCEGTLPAAAAHEFERHLAVCPSCIAYLAGYEQVIAMAKSTRGPELEPEPVPEALVEAIRKARLHR
jgi:anti-sigma factor RsiW